MSREAEVMIRLSDVLAQRDAPMDRVLKAVELVGTSSLYLAVSAFSNRLVLLVPSYPGVVNAVVPGYADPELPSEGLLRAVIDGPRVSAGVTLTDAQLPGDLVKPLPYDARSLYLSAIESLQRIAPSSIMNHTRYLTEPTVSIAVEFAPRLADAEEQFVRGLDAVAAELGIPTTQRELWRTLYPLASATVGLSVAVECEDGWPRPLLDILYGASTWDRAIDVTNAIVGKSSVEAREIAATFGTLAGALELEAPRGLEIVLGTGARPDVLVWLAPR